MSSRITSRDFLKVSNKAKQRPTLFSSYFTLQYILQGRQCIQDFCRTVHNCLIYTSHQLELPKCLTGQRLTALCCVHTTECYTAVRAQRSHGNSSLTGRIPWEGSHKSIYCRFYLCKFVNRSTMNQIRRAVLSEERERELLARKGNKRPKWFVYHSRGNNNHVYM